jgi:hypothetical protein
MKRRTLGLIAAGLLVAALVVGAAGVALAWGPNSPGGPGSGPGRVMSGWGQGGYGPGPGTGGGYGYGPGGMMGGGYGYGPGGMMGPWAQATPTGPAISFDQAQKNVQRYVDQIGNSDLTLDEMMEFQNNFYAIVKEKSTGIGAFEVLVNKWTGAVFPEYGPNMMWNTKYGMMGQNPWMGQMMGYQLQTGPMTVTADQAKQIAQKWLDQYQPGSTTETPDTFYGYYTLHTLKGGKITGMLSVNGYSGQVWYHTWHGAFIQMKDLGG